MTDQRRLPPVKPDAPP